MNAPDTIAFNFFDFVWLRIDEDGQSPGMGQIVGIIYKPHGMLYSVQWSATHIAEHYEQELTKDKPSAVFQ